MDCFVDCIPTAYYGLLHTGQCPPQGTAIEVSLPPLLLPLSSSLPPSSNRFHPLSITISLAPSIPLSFPSFRPVARGGGFRGFSRTPLFMNPPFYRKCEPPHNSCNKPQLSEYSIGPMAGRSREMHFPHWDRPLQGIV